MNGPLANLQGAIHPLSRVCRVTDAAASVDVEGWGSSLTGMDQRISLISLAVADTAVARRFYVDGLGWTPADEVAGEVIFIQVGQGLLLSLWDAAEFEKEVGSINRGTGVAPITLAHNVRTPVEVDDVLDQAVAAGATLIAAGQERVWGGYTGYFADPDGYRWEVAFNPGSIGKLVLDAEA